MKYRNIAGVIDTIAIYSQFKNIKNLHT